MKRKSNRGTLIHLGGAECDVTALLWRDNRGSGEDDPKRATRELPSHKLCLHFFDHLVIRAAQIRVSDPQSVQKAIDRSLA